MRKLLKKLIKWILKEEFENMKYAKENLIYHIDANVGILDNRVSAIEKSLKEHIDLENDGKYKE